MTEKLYLNDDAVRTFEATVERALDDRITLDRTQFYPTGGGQPHDTGTLRAADDPDRHWRVVDVAKADTIYHTLAPVDDTLTPVDGRGTPSLPSPGTDVVGEIDWDRRHAHARYHTAQHLLSALLLREFDARTTGNQLSADHAHLDAEYGRFAADDLTRIENRLNELVDDDRPVERYIMNREAAKASLDADRTRIDLLPDSITELRIVEVGGSDDGTEEGPYDRTACAGTHVGATGEIGEIVVTGRETKGSDEERVRFAFADHLEDGRA